MAASVVAASLIPKNQKIFAVSADSTLVEVIQLLAERRILSAPVVERLAADGGRPSDVLGFIDLFDIISYVLLAYTEDHDTVDGTHFRLWCQNLRTLQYRGRVFANHAVRDCISKPLKGFVVVFVTTFVGALTPVHGSWFLKNSLRASDFSSSISKR
eukprot:TRINITY_DN1499_c0_g1_i1.p1 TRINITY_DN1499_c0_g1~~TRINITY_DN1499_c0_g1_i1.p1  ORF type:complete len:157 (-),score=39.83 TRINITY_DN1499_c0_g1_i1:230-700(-)